MTGTEQPAGAEQPGHVPAGPVFWTCLVIGAGVVGYGLVGAWMERDDTHPLNLGVWLAGVGVAHDLLLAPVIALLAWASRWVPAVARTPARLGLALSTLLTVVFWPIVQRWGRADSIPSLLPLDYGRNLVVVLTVVWVAVGVVVVARYLRERH